MVDLVDKCSCSTGSTILRGRQGPGRGNLAGPHPFAVILTPSEERRRASAAPGARKILGARAKKKRNRYLRRKYGKLSISQEGKWRFLLAFHYKRKRRGFNLTGAFLDRLWAVQEGRCAYCECELGGSDSHVLEHMTPLCRGGLSTEDNVCFACVDCNTRKYDRTAEEFEKILVRSVNGGERRGKRLHRGTRPSSRDGADRSPDAGRATAR
jgi:5-methylcytosine-specific restriction endonuclease McrA